MLMFVGGLEVGRFSRRISDRAPNICVDPYSLYGGNPQNQHFGLRRFALKKLEIIAPPRCSLDLPLPCCSPTLSIYSMYTLFDCTGAIRRCRVQSRVGCYAPEKLLQTARVIRLDDDDSRISNELESLRQNCDLHQCVVRLSLGLRSTYNRLQQ